MSRDDGRPGPSSDRTIITNLSMISITQPSFDTATGTPPSSENHSPKIVHFAESLDEDDPVNPADDDGGGCGDDDDDDNDDTGGFYRRSESFTVYGGSHSDGSQPKVAPAPASASMYLLCPQDQIQWSRSSPASPAGSQVSIVGNLISTGRKLPLRHQIDHSSSGGNHHWKSRTRCYSKRRGQERSIDRERQPSVCSDSETDNISVTHKIEDILQYSANATKKWSLPLPVVAGSSESDSSWSARSGDEATEDERSPVPSPSASTHSNDDRQSHPPPSHPPPPPPKPDAAPPSSPKSPFSSFYSKKSSDLVSASGVTVPENHHHNRHHKQQQQQSSYQILSSPSSPSSGSPAPIKYDVSISSSTPPDHEQTTTSKSSSKDQKIGGKGRRKKKMSKAAESHDLQRMKTTNYGRCIICDAYVYFWGFECVQCQLICHKKCVKKMAIMCPQRPLPPRSSILSLELCTLPEYEMVPLLVKKCTDEIERRSLLQRPGIYRMTGVASRVQRLLKSFESGPQLIDLSDVNANDLTSVLKVFLRELKVPLITNDVYKDFIEIGRIYRDDQTLATDGVAIGGGQRSALIRRLHQAVQKLEPHHYATLEHMIQHLSRVTAHQRHNSMTAAALGIIFAPTFFRPRDTVNDLYTEVFEAGPQARVIELLIRFNREIFESDSDVIDGEPPLVLSMAPDRFVLDRPPHSGNDDNTETGTGGATSYSCTTGGGSSTSATPSSANLTSTSVSSVSPPITPPPPPPPTATQIDPSPIIKMNRSTPTVQMEPETPKSTRRKFSPTTFTFD